MEKKTTLILLVIVTLLGSIICFYGTNLILSDVSNMFYMTITKDCISSFPILLVAIQFVLAAIALIRLYRYPKYKRYEARLYCRILIFLAVLGIVTSILTGTMIYGSFAAPYPFTGATISCLIWHLAALICGIIALSRTRNWALDSARRKMSVRHIVFTVFFCVLIFYTFNRLGALLWMPVYVYMPTFYMTVWFYLSLLLPLAILVHNCIHMFGLDVGHPKLGLYYILCVMAADIILAVIVFSLGRSSTQFISNISPAVAIERLLTMPVDTIFHFVLVFILAAYSLWIVLRHRKEAGK